MTGIASHWLWLVAGLLLLTAEALAPGVYLFWIGLAAAGTGAVLLLAPLGFTAQLLLFAALGLASIVLGRLIQSRERSVPTDAPFLNERGRALVGKVLPLETAIAGGVGSVRIGDTVWRVAGSDAPAGARVKVTGVDGGTLVVEAA